MPNTRRLPLARRRSVRLLTGAGVALTLAACSSSGANSPNAAATAAHAAAPHHIFTAPAGLVSAAQPQPNGTMWLLAGSAASKGLYALDVANGKMLNSTSVSNAASTVAQSASGQLALGLATPTSGAVELLNGSTGAVTTTVPVGAPVRQVVPGANGTTYYVLNATSTSASVAVVSAQPAKVTSSVPVPLDTVSVAVSPDQQSLYALEPTGLVDQISLGTGHVLARFPIGHSGRFLALSPSGNTLYALKGIGTTCNVAEVNVATEAVKSALPAPSNCVGMVLSPDGATLYDAVGTPTLGNIQAFGL